MDQTALSSPLRFSTLLVLASKFSCKSRALKFTADYGLLLTCAHAYRFLGHRDEKDLVRASVHAT